ncbi:hypothetical protein FML96_23130 [Escherichia coli]|nr:hypothetical protein CA593_17455 [Escherichia coli]EFK14917.1 hypothetical protein HMPREF9541_02741 [Escherichia coli MS 116-1]ESE03193.1 hypothetical protein HMPREF1616_03445 [Escherichia coli 908658]ATM08846.1 hypothetical protein CRN02_01665 [Escherichia coli]AUN47253.1 hypothetical protein C0634_11095 [Escherichia coli]
MQEEGKVTGFVMLTGIPVIMEVHSCVRRSLREWKSGDCRQGVLKGKHVSPASCAGGQHHFFYVVTRYAFRL